jgi:hypothetical protein
MLTRYRDKLCAEGRRFRQRVALKGMGTAFFGCVLGAGVKPVLLRMV